MGDKFTLSNDKTSLIKVIAVVTFFSIMLGCGNMSIQETKQNSHSDVINEAMRHELSGDLDKVSELLSTIDYIELEGELLKNYLYLKKKSEKKFDYDLEIENKKFEHKGDYIYATGYVKNIGRLDLKYIKLKLSILDAQDNIIDSNWSYLNGSEILYPNEQKSFEIMTKYKDGLRKVKIEVIDFMK